MSFMEPDLVMFRAMANASLPDTCAIIRPAKSGTLNEISGVWTPAADASVYTGACRIQPPSSSEIEEVWGEVEVTVQRYMVTIPYDTAVVELEDVVQVATSSDDQLTDVELRVVGVVRRSWLVRRRLACEVVS